MNILVATPLLLLSSLPAGAVIVAGASGGANTTNNTTAAQFQSEYGIAAPIYENVISYSDASGVYLGYNAATRDVWILSARHVSANGTYGATVIIDGLTYNRQADGDGYGHLVGGDLRLIRYRRNDLAVPSLPAVPLATTVPAANAALLMIGYGQNRTENATNSATVSDATSTAVGTGYHWSGSNIKRWGVNVVEAEFLDGLETGTPATGTTGNLSLGPYSTTSFMTNFDQPGANQWLSSNEAQASLGDSGGGAFSYSGGQWHLTGIFTAVAPFDGQQGNTAAFGNLTLLTDVGSYEPAIRAALGNVTLVPEPRMLALLALAMPLALRRRRH